MVIGNSTDVFWGIFLVGKRRGLVEGFTWVELSLEEFFMEKRISMKGMHDFLALLKKNKDKINVKSFFN